MIYKASSLDEKLVKQTLGSCSLRVRRSTSIYMHNLAFWWYCFLNQSKTGRVFCNGTITIAPRLQESVWNRNNLLFDPFCAGKSLRTAWGIEWGVVLDRAILLTFNSVPTSIIPYPNHKYQWFGPISSSPAKERTRCQGHREGSPAPHHSHETSPVQAASGHRRSQGANLLWCRQQIDLKIMHAHLETMFCLYHDRSIIYHSWTGMSFSISRRLHMYPPMGPHQLSQVDDYGALPDLIADATTVGDKFDSFCKAYNIKPWHLKCVWLMSALTGHLRASV